MKNTILLLILITTFSACEKDPCKDAVCLNGGACNNGSCACEEGYEGVNCEIKRKTSEVKYSLECKSCNITWRNKEGLNEGALSVSSTWSYSFTGYSGQSVFISASNANSSDTSAPVGVKIHINGILYKEYTDSSAFSATAVGYIP